MNRIFNNFNKKIVKIACLVLCALIAVSMVFMANTSKVNADAVSDYINTLTYADYQKYLEVKNELNGDLILFIEYNTWRKSNLSAKGENATLTDYKNFLQSSTNADYLAWLDSDFAIDANNSRTITVADYEVVCAWLTENSYSKNETGYSAYNTYKTNYDNEHGDDIEAGLIGSFSFTSFNYSGANLKLKNSDITLEYIKDNIANITFNVDMKGNISVTGLTVDSTKLQTINNNSLIKKVGNLFVFSTQIDGVNITLYLSGANKVYTCSEEIIINGVASNIEFTIQYN